MRLVPPPDDDGPECECCPPPSGGCLPAVILTMAAVSMVPMIVGCYTVGRWLINLL